jgi:drug/metabolite transporter (DMT)-like permease
MQKSSMACVATSKRQIIDMQPSHKVSRFKQVFSRGETWALVSVLDYTVISLLVRRASGSGDPAIAVTLRALPALLVTLLVTLATPRRRAQLNPKSPRFLGWKPIGAILTQAILIFSIGNWLNFMSLRYGGLAITTPVASLSAIFGGILAAVILHEVFNGKMLAGMTVSTMGVLLLTHGQSTGTAASPFWVRAVILSLIGAMGSAAGGVFLTYALRRKADIFVAMLLSTGTAVLSMFVLLLVRGQVALYWTSPPAVLRDLAIAGLFNAISLLAITQSLALCSWAVSTSISRLGTVVSPLAGLIFLHEQINTQMWLGIIVVTVGVFIVQWGQMRGAQQIPAAVDNRPPGALRASDSTGKDSK